jgi:hypothetical protein
MPKDPWEVVSQEPIKTKGNTPSDPWSVVSVEPVSNTDFSVKLKGMENEGLYAMEDESGKQIPVPFSRVEEAGKAGLKFSKKITIPNAKGREDYAKDRFATLQPPPGAKSIGPFYSPLMDWMNFTKKGKIVPQTPIPEEVEGQPGAWSKIRETFQKAAEPKGHNRPVLHANNVSDASWDAAKNAFSPIGNIGGKFANTLFGTVDMIPQVISASKDLLSNDPRKSVTGFTSLTNMMPPEMVVNYASNLKKIAKDHPDYAVEDVIGTGLAFWASGKLTDAAVKTVLHPVEALKTARQLPGEIARSTTEAITKTQPRNVKVAGEEALKKSLEHKENTMEELGKRSDAHDKEVKDVKEHNNRVVEKHNIASDKINRERIASEHALELRRAEEANLETAAKEQDQKYADAEKKANSDNDAAWNKVRSKTAGHSTDISQLKKTTEIAADQADPATSALFKRIIKGEQPTLPSLTRASRAIRYVDSAGNPVDPMTMGPATLEDKVKSGEYKVEHVTETINPDDPGYGELYEKKFGEPPPVGGGPAQFNRLQRWYSYIQNKMYSGWVSDGHLYKAYGMVRDAIDDAMQDIAQQANATADLDNARKLHTEKMEAFHDSPNEPQTVASKSLREQTPEQVAAKARAERLKKVARYDPSILDTSKRIEEIQTRLKGMKTEDELRKSLPKHIPPPSLDHPIESYRLKPEPEPFTGKPVEHETKGKTIWQEEKLKDKTAPVDYAKIKAEELKKFQKTTREYGLKRAIYASFTSIPAAIVTAMLGKPKVALLEATVGPAVLIGSQILANLMDKPEVVAWVEKVTPKDTAEFDKLPPEQKSLFTQDMMDLADAARKKNIKVSPSLTKWLATNGVRRAVGGYAGVTGANPPSPQELKKQADELYKKIYGTEPPHPTEEPQTIGPQSSTQGHTHIFNPSTGQIEPSNA